MAAPCMRVYRLLSLMLALVLLLSPLPVQAKAKVGQSPGASSGSLPLDITAERIDYRQDQDVYEADGSVVIQQGVLRLTADHVTIQSLPGLLTATGHVHLTDPQADVTTDRLELNINTEAGVVTHGQLYVPSTNSLVTGRLMQRFSEYHYRVKDGTFTNCDAKDGEVPAWRIRFTDLDLNSGDSAAFTGAWLCVNEQPIVPIPTMTYPLTNRQSGFLIPFIGYDNRFGFHAQQGYYWAIDPSQDLLVAPSYYSRLGYGAELDYRYVIDRRSRGQWSVDFIQQTQLPNVSGVDQNSGQAHQARALITGTHTQQVTSDLLLRVQANFVTDPNMLQQLSNSGTQRALPSNESNLLANQRLGAGNVYLWSQYLQPLESGGVDTFQRLPEIGYTLPNRVLFNTPVLFGAETNVVNFYRSQGFQQNRLDFAPGLTTDVIDFGHMIGLTPQLVSGHLSATSKSTLAENEHIQAAFKWNPKPTMVSFSDPKPSVQGVYTLVNTFGPMMLGQLAQQGINFNLPPLPPFADIEQHLLPKIGRAHV